MASDRIINNLNSVISTKNEIKGILRDNGIDPGDVFSDYPNMLRSIVGGGSISGDTVNSYISAYLDSYNFIDQDELSANSYVTNDVLSAQSYITEADLPTIDENIIPKETGTYTLGDATSLYSNVYSSSLNVGNNSRVYNDGGGITLSINNNAGVRLGSSNLYSKTSGAFSLGTSSNFWNATYTSDVWLNSKNRFNNKNNNQINVQLNDSWRYTFHVNNFGPAADNTRDLGESSIRWKSTYTANIYADNAYISSETYLPVNTYWYDGTTYHWLGSLFN